MTQNNEELIKAFKNHLDYYKDLKDKWEFLKTPEDRAFHAGKTQGMLLGLEVIERISIPQPEQLNAYVYEDVDEEYKGYFAVHIPIKMFEVKEDALNWCKRFNLKLVNEKE